MELLFSGPLVALRCRRKISPGLGCMVPCLYDKDMCVSGVMYYECYNVVTWEGDLLYQEIVVDWHCCSIRSDTDMNVSLLQHYCGYI